MALTDERLVYGAVEIAIDRDKEILKIVNALGRLGGEAEGILDDAMQAASRKLAKAEREIIGKRYIWHDSSAKAEDLAAIKPYRGKHDGGIRAAGKRRNMAARTVSPRVKSLTATRPGVYIGRMMNGAAYHAFRGSGAKSKGFLAGIKGNLVFVDRPDSDRSHLSAIQSLSVADMIKSQAVLDEAAEQADFNATLQDEIHKRVRAVLKR